ncbi:hypothetical protein RIF29_40843 [Crotalaria pallida]|uniref:Uncharacterized protein n=1 Tax=Crotalaria pallida TaxID=3830 RepID=A0AAN9HR19_CROPI
MGNCMPCHIPKKQTIDSLIEGREMEVKAPLPAEKINNASCGHYIVVHRKLLHKGEVYHLAPLLKQSAKSTSHNRKLKARNVKIVVSAEQLKLVLSGSNKFRIKTRADRVRSKWQPSLPTIHEVQNFRGYNNNGCSLGSSIIS